MKASTMKRVTLLIVGVLFFPSILVAAVVTEHSSGCGDVFGDLVHIKRDLTTGQPILQKRWIEYPQDIFDWGYCPIPVDANGNEISFVDLTCDPVDASAVVEVDYFGRLSGGRTKERNIRMHFDEIISNIKAAGKVRYDVAGRMMLGFDCFLRDADLVCSSWKTIDSPMENMALYVRLMKYGHLQTDPMEVDIWAAGDPAAGVQYHPALGPEDWAKLGENYLPVIAKNNPDYCFSADSTFNSECALPDSLRPGDFMRSASALAAASGKTGKITVDLVQYMNRILKIPLATETTLENIDLLPALIRDCGDNPDSQLPVSECAIYPAEEGMVAPADEMFVDFGRVAYDRMFRNNKSLKVVAPLDSGVWVERTDVQLIDWLEFVNGPAGGGDVQNVQGFVNATADYLRTIQFIHNYDIPADLGWEF